MKIVNSWWNNKQSRNFIIRKAKEQTYLHNKLITIVPNSKSTIKGALFTIIIIIL